MRLAGRFEFKKFNIIFPCAQWAGFNNCQNNEKTGNLAGFGQNHLEKTKIYLHWWKHVTGLCSQLNAIVVLCECSFCQSRYAIGGI